VIKIGASLTAFNIIKYAEEKLFLFYEIFINLNNDLSGI
jgi:hypothetical protein